MKATRKRYTGDFKAKVALEAIRGELTVAEIASKHGIHPTMVTTWKKQAIDGLAWTFSGTTEAAKAAGEADIGAGQSNDFDGMPDQKTLSRVGLRDRVQL